MKRSTIKSRFLDWYLSVSLKNACEWFFKCYLLLWLIILLIAAIFWSLEYVYIIFTMSGLLFLSITYIFNRILINRILQVQCKKSVLIYLLNVTYIIGFFAGGVIEDIQYYMNFIYVVSLFVFNALIIRYGYPIYRRACWFMLYVGVFRTFADDILNPIVGIWEIAFYVQLYLTAKKYKM